MPDTSLIVKLAVSLAAVEGKTYTTADFEKPFEPGSAMHRYVRLAEGVAGHFKEPRKQIGSYVEALMSAIAEQTPYGEGISAWDSISIEAGIREVVGNNDAVYWAAEEAFTAGHQSCLDTTVPALFADPTHIPNVGFLWEQYTPSDAVVEAVGALGN